MIIMGKKISAYQKLKSENLELKRDIYKLVMLQDSTAKGNLSHYLITKIKWTSYFELENNFWNNQVINN